MKHPDCKVLFQNKLDIKKIYKKMKEQHEQSYDNAKNKVTELKTRNFKINNFKTKC